MEISLEFGTQNRHKLEYSRNWFSGSERLLIDGQEVGNRSVLSPSTHFNFSLKQQYQLSVGSEERYQVLFEKERPLLFAGLRPHTYRIFVNEKLIHEEHGY